MIHSLVPRLLFVFGFACAVAPCDGIVTIGSTGDPSSCGGTTGVKCP